MCTFMADMSAIDVVYTDHSALQWLFQIKYPPNRLFRWSVRLSVYTYTIHHRPGKLNAAADALSRQPISFLIQAAELKRAQEQNPSNDPTVTIDTLGFEVHRQYVVPQKLRLKVLQLYHDEYGHPGIATTK